MSLVEEFIRFEGEARKAQDAALSTFLQGKTTRKLKRMLESAEDPWLDESGEITRGVHRELERRKVKV